MQSNSTMLLPGETIQLECNQQASYRLYASLFNIVLPILFFSVVFIVLTCFVGGHHLPHQDNLSFMQMIKHHLQLLKNPHLWISSLFYLILGFFLISKIIYRSLNNMSKQYQFTSQRIIITSGFLGVQVDTLPYAKITSAVLKRPFLFSFASVYVYTQSVIASDKSRIYGVTLEQAEKIQRMIAEKHSQ